MPYALIFSFLQLLRLGLLFLVHQGLAPSGYTTLWTMPMKIRGQASANGGGRSVRRPPQNSDTNNANDNCHHQYCTTAIISMMMMIIVMMLMNMIRPSRHPSPHIPFHTCIRTSYNEDERIQPTAIMGFIISTVEMVYVEFMVYRWAAYMVLGIISPKSYRMG